MCKLCDVHCQSSPLSLRDASDETALFTGPSSASVKPDVPQVQLSYVITVKTWCGSLGDGSEESGRFGCYRVHRSCVCAPMQHARIAARYGSTSATP
jgi:hypothetical protein